MGAIAEGSSTSYMANWEQWKMFEGLRGELLLFMAHVGVTLKRAAGTVRQKLFGIGYMHLVQGKITTFYICNWCKGISLLFDTCTWCKGISQNRYARARV